MRKKKLRKPHARATETFNSHWPSKVSAGGPPPATWLLCSGFSNIGERLFALHLSPMFLPRELRSAVREMKSANSSPGLNGLLSRVGGFRLFITLRLLRSCYSFLVFYSSVFRSYNLLLNNKGTTAFKSLALWRKWSFCIIILLIMYVVRIINSALSLLLTSLLAIRSRVYDISVPL